MDSFLMPRVSLSDDEEMVVSRWLVPEGTQVKEGQPVLEVETAKANMEVEAPQAGILTSFRVHEGAAVSPGDTLALIAAPGESVAQGGENPPPPAEAQSVTTNSPSANGSITAGASPASKSLSTSISAPFDLPGALYGLPSRRRTAVVPPPIASASVSTSADAARPPRSAPEGAFEVPLSKHRVAVGRLMNESWRIPQFTVRKDVRMDVAESVVAGLRAAGLRATLTDVLLRAVARALVEHPEVNRLFLGDRLFQMSEPVVALAADSPAGVVAPVLHDLHTATWARVVAERQRVVSGAREGRLQPRDLNGGTFAVSNVGPLGGDAVTPLITPPQVAILGVGAVRSQEGGRVSTLQIVGDHRALDGADGARFLATLSGLLSAPLSSSELGELS